MQEDMIYAEPEYRKKVIRLFLIIVVIGLLCLGLGLPYLKGYLLSLPPQTALKILKPLLIIVLASPIILSIYLISYVYRGLRQGRIPPEGTRVWRDTPVFYDSEAKKRGVILLTLAVLLMDICIGAVVLVLVFYDTLFF